MKKQPDDGMDAVHTRIRVAIQDWAECGGDCGFELDAANERLNRALAECEDSECEICGQLACPYGDPLHYHHDGCPSCAAAFDEDEQ